MSKHDLWMQISAGAGPAECCWAAHEVFLRVKQEAAARGVGLEVVHVEPGPERDTAQSILLELAGVHSAEFAKSWEGTVQWTARSPFRPEHKRKNWFVGISVTHPPEETALDAKDVRWEVMRASGPGGQHVNKTESAVRVTHVLSGTQATASEERSQHRNRKLALARLVEKLQLAQKQEEAGKKGELWRTHRELERGNPVRSLRP